MLICAGFLVVVNQNTVGSDKIGLLINISKRKKCSRLYNNRCKLVFISFVSYSTIPIKFISHFSHIAKIYKPCILKGDIAKNIIKRYFPILKNNATFSLSACNNCVQLVTTVLTKTTIIRIYWLLTISMTMRNMLMPDNTRHGGLPRQLIITASPMRVYLHCLI